MPGVAVPQNHAALLLKAAGLTPTPCATEESAGNAIASMKVLVSLFLFLRYTLALMRFIPIRIFNTKF
ncbi:hypothetical protein KCP71_17150 [Salmonella enterica subsp. enterica]|nr:hypothetical protein KCP71_17150 [Salmonella enterica subsp. enterica]